MRSVLLIAFHFPPLIGSSGLQRTLRFAQYLPEFGWKPIVLTVAASAYETADEHSLQQIPDGCEVIRTFCPDVSRHLSIKGRYPGIAALPDRWTAWQWFAVRAGRRLIRKRNVQAIWSTYPIATAHLIGWRLARRTGLPWIADFRDPMAHDGYPADRRRRRSFEQVEARCAARADRLMFVSPSALAMYRDRFPATPADRFVLLENGFDDSTFEGLPTSGGAAAGSTPVILHSGIIYPSERDPGALFEALGRLSASGRIRPGDFVIRFRAAVHDDLLRQMAIKHRVEEFIDIAPAIPYREALREMCEAAALLVMQGSNCNMQIPAKVYEYLRAGRPILGLTDPSGDTGRLLRQFEMPFITPLESKDEIERNLPLFLRSLESGDLPVPPRALVDRFSRRSLSGRLAAYLDQTASSATRETDHGYGVVAPPTPTSEAG